MHYDDKLSTAARELALSFQRFADMIDQANGAPAPLSPTTPRAPTPAPTPAASAGSAIARFGRHKDSSLSSLPHADLSWYCEQLVKSVADPTKAKWRQSNEADLAAARAELTRRG